MKVSIVVPVYNVERVLRQCLTSIAGQSFSDFECILVDDGSTDDSGKLCDAISREDSRFRVVHKKNGGVSSARNRGLDEVCGEWVAFVDADDWLDVDYLKNFMESPSLREETLLFQGWKIQRKCGDSSGEMREEKHILRELSSEEKTTAQNHLLECWSPWGKLFNRSIIERKNLRFPASLSLGEDTIFFYQYLREVRELRVLENVGYNYRISPVSLSKKQTPWSVHYAGSMAISEAAISEVKRFLRGEYFSRKRLESLLFFEQHALRLETLYYGDRNSVLEKSERISALRKAFGKRFALLRLMTPVFTPNRNYALLWLLFLLLPISVIDWALQQRFRK